MDRQLWIKLSRHVSVGRLVLGVVALVLLWNELLSYAVVSWHWGTLHTVTSPRDEVRALFVADPQLIGYEDESASFGSYSRWDCDRYLQRTFQRAYSYVRPDVVVFMGDLLDEGSTATEADYQAYMDRFHSIFNIPKQIQVVFLSGDNDVGGEGTDRKLPWKVNRFNKHFMGSEAPPGVVNVDFLDFLRLDLDVMEVVMSKYQQLLQQLRRSSSAPFRILLNHAFILNRSSGDSRMIVQLSEASMIFTAHTHLSHVYTCHDCHKSERDLGAGQQGLVLAQMEHLDSAAVRTFNMSDITAVREITVPTCSYRMGVKTMGYGAAVFKRNGEVRYTVLWSPSRYPQLFTYLTLIQIFGALGCLRLLVWLWMYVRFKIRRRSGVHASHL